MGGKAPTLATNALNCAHALQPSATQTSEHYRNEIVNLGVFVQVNEVFESGHRTGACDKNIVAHQTFEHAQIYFRPNFAQLSAPNSVHYT